MRSTALVAALLAVAAVTAWLVLARQDAAPKATTGSVALLGDSLNVGVEPYLAEELRGVAIVADDRVGRRTDEGIAEVESGRARLAPHVVVSLGTNDLPEGADAFRADVARLSRLIGPGRCLVWATIWRNGAPDEAFNSVLRDAAAANGRMRLVEWAAMVQAHPEWLAPDGLHANEAGYRKRAAAIAKAVRACAPEQTAEAR